MLVPEMLEELRAAQSALEPEIEGFHDLLGTNLELPTRQQVTWLLERSDRRHAHLNACIAALKELLADGYPTVEVVALDGPSFRDLLTNMQTMQAAFNRFQPKGEAVSGEIILGAPAPPKADVSL
jgi:hypothetical protein